VFALGTTFNVSGTDFPTNFSATPEMLGASTTVNGLSLSETITPVSATQEWIVFTFANPSGPVIGDPSADFSLAISGFQTVAPAILSSVFAYFTQDGTPFAPLTPASGFGVETNPITGTGPVLDFVGFTPTAPFESFNLSVFSNPASFLGAVGVDATTANGFDFAALLTLPVPEPASLAVLGCGLAGLGAVRRRARRPT